MTTAIVPLFSGEIQESFAVTKFLCQNAHVPCSIKRTFSYLYVIKVIALLHI